MDIAPLAQQAGDTWEYTLLVENDMTLLAPFGQGEEGRTAPGAQAQHSSLAWSVPSVRTGQRSVCRVEVWGIS